MSRLVAILFLIVAFLGTRLVMLYYVDNPDSYPLANAPFTADVDNVFQSAGQRIASGEEPYTDFDLEYPPGVVPFLVLPENSWPEWDGYRHSFARLMLLVDAAGLLGLIVLAKRWRSLSGPWMWILLIALIGPLAYVRFDLVPAVGTIWALERASVGRWPASGGWLGYGAMTKVYPGFLLPLAVFAGPRRSSWRVAAAFVVAAGATLAIVIALAGGDPSEIYQDAFSSRLGAGVHLETTWGSMLLIAERFGLGTPIEFYLSTYYFQGGAVAFLEPLALALTLVSVILGTLVAAGCQEEDRDVTFAYAMFATVALLLAFSTTFSPQFVIWLAAPAAAVATIRNSTMGWIPWLTIPVFAMTQYIYPYQYQRILDRDWLGLSVLAGRNLLILLTGVLALVAIVRSQGGKFGVLHTAAAARKRWSGPGEANGARTG